jgi:hypothetical protein
MMMAYLLLAAPFEEDVRSRDLVAHCFERYGHRTEVLQDRRAFQEQVIAAIGLALARRGIEPVPQTGERG